MAQPWVIQECIVAPVYGGSIDLKLWLFGSVQLVGFNGKNIDVEISCALLNCETRFTLITSLVFIGNTQLKESDRALIFSND